VASPDPITVDEYLNMAFDDADREFVDGEILERNTGELPHSSAQCRLVELFYEFRKIHPFHACISLRLRLGPTRIRIPDVAVFHPREPTELVPATPPLIVAEVVSREDRHTEIIGKLSEFLSWGVKHVWLADPWQRQLSIYTASGLSAAPSLDLPKFDIRITPADIFD
jgi:Uma2 family endonuclease